MQERKRAWVYDEKNDKKEKRKKMKEKINE